MAVLEFRMPDIGEGVSEGEIVQWHAAPGDVLSEDDPMVEVMTDKATVTIGSPCDGTVEDVLVAVGEKARVGQVIVRITVQEGATAPKRWSSPPATAVGDLQETLPGTEAISARRDAFGDSDIETVVAETDEVRGRPGIGHNGSSNGSRPPVAYYAAKPLATPATRRLAKEMGVDLRRVPPTGPSGRVTQGDVTAAARRGIRPVRTPRAVEPREAKRAGELRGTRTPFIGMRRRIAERMRAAKQTAAHFTFVEECDVTRLVELRSRLRVEAERRGVALNYLPFVVKAVVEALRAHPVLNSALDEAQNELVHHDAFHIGIATATEQGLMVPVIKNADRLRLLELAGEVTRLAEGARAGTLSPDELQGSTFTITSLGKQSGLLATPILNVPEVGILGVHRIKEKPVVRDGEITIGHVMLLSLSMDHRIVDGHIGAAFAYDVIEYLENPERLFFEYL